MSKCLMEVCLCQNCRIHQTLREGLLSRNSLHIRQERRKDLSNLHYNNHKQFKQLSICICNSNQCWKPQLLWELISNRLESQVASSKMKTLAYMDQAYFIYLDYLIIENFIIRMHQLVTGKIVENLMTTHLQII